MVDVNRDYTIAETLLSIQGVHLWLGKGARRRLILRDVDFRIDNIVRPGLKQGQVKGLLGPSGIGKTQLSKVITGNINPKRDDVDLTGSVFVGVDQVPPTPGMVGVVTQKYEVIPSMTVLGNLVFAGMRGGLSKAEAKEKAEHYLELFGLTAQRNLWPETQISGGQRQRVAIIQQVMVGHKFIFMDEPFSGLDVIRMEQVAALIAKLTSEDELLTIIVVTHDIGAAISVSDELILMGLERDEGTGAFKEGARIVARSDLVQEGLAWDPDIRHNPRFLEHEAVVAERFRTLS